MHGQQVNILDFVKSLRDDITGLIRDEVALAKTEIGEKVATASRNVGYLAVGALVAYAGLIFHGGDFHHREDIRNRRKGRRNRPQSYRRGRQGRGERKPRTRGPEEGLIAARQGESKPASRAIVGSQC
jgi:hypothetical protein